jgi:hypothetical protein
MQTSSSNRWVKKRAVKISRRGGEQMQWWSEFSCIQNPVARVFVSDGHVVNISSLE